MSFHVGQRVKYLINMGHKKVRELPATVTHVGPKRVTIVTDRYPHPRQIKPRNLVPMEITDAGSASDSVHSS